MRLYKTVAQIFLILSILNFTFAGIAFFSQTPTTDEMRVDLGPGAEDVTVASSEKGHTQSEELPEWLGRPESTAGNLHSRGRLLERQLVNADDLEKDKFFSPELNRKMKEYLILGSIAGVFTGVANGMQKEIIGTVSPNSYVLFFYASPPPTSCQPLNGVSHKPILTTVVYLSETVGRSVEPLDDEPSRDQEDLVSRCLSNIKDKDLQMLSIISRRILSGLD